MKYVWDGEHWTERALEERFVSGAPAVISDAMDPLLHPVSGEIIDSKSRFRAVTRETGCVELGNDAPMVNNLPQTNKNQLRSDIYEAIQQLEQGRQAPRLRSGEGLTRRYG